MERCNEHLLACASFYTENGEAEFRNSLTIFLFSESLHKQIRFICIEWQILTVASGTFCDIFVIFLLVTYTFCIVLFPTFIDPKHQRRTLHLNQITFRR